jgi:chemotaxis methyl-accepting protein methylase
VPSGKPAERDPDLAQLVTKIARERRVGLDAYKESCLKRRVAVRMRACRVNSYDDYAALLDRDEAEYEKLLNALTINVTKFFRNKDTWEAIARNALAALRRARGAEFRCWSAGCASGEEPYTLAILLAEAASERALSLDSARIDATDLDASSLERARRGVYGESAFDEMPRDLRLRYFEGSEARQIKTEIRRLVEFRRHDITSDPAPAPPYDLILCRNVLIYFDRTSQDRLLSRFVDVLKPGGFLVLGRAETLLGRLRDALQLVDTRERIYRRP